jgi:hypothetical protein
MATMKEYALAYATPNGERNAWAVFPLAAGSKVPTKGSAGCTEATTDRERISAWWTKAPHANIGIACGAINGFVVIDVDHHDDVDGADSLRELEAQMGPLPDTVEALTPNGGRHLFYKYPTGHNIRNTSGIAPGIDIRANGGYVVGMPSKLTGVAAAYQWEAASYPNERPVAPLPAAWEQWLIQRCARFEAPTKAVQGTRNDTVFRYAASLRAQNYPPEKIREMMGTYNAEHCDPPLDDREVGTIFTSVLRYPPNTPVAQMAEVPAAAPKQAKDRLTIEALAEELKLRGIAVKYNLINCEYEISGRTDAGFTMSQDDLLARMHNALADQYKGASFETLAAYITFTAREHRYNPVLEALEAVKWDGVDRLPQLYTLMGLDADSLSQALVRKWLMQTVALLFNDPADPFGADGCLVLNGAQGAGKTSLFRHLAMRDAWFGEGLTVNDRDKDTTRRIVTTWIAELGEVESTLKSDISALKAFVSASIDHYRLPYGRADVVAPRMTSLCATCNSDRYLIDPTGNRRWWSVPFRRTVPREELLALDAAQLWAQIFATVAPLPYTEKAGCFRLTEAERELLAIRNNEFEKPIKAQPEVEDILAKADLEKLTTRNMTATEFREHWPALRAYSAQQVGAALKKCGIEMTKGGKGRRAADLPVPKTYY